MSSHPLKNYFKNIFCLLSAMLFSTALQAGVVDLETTDDATVSNQNRNANYGSDTSLLLRNDGNFGWNRQAYFQFDVSSITDAVTAATFDVGLIFNTPFGSEASTVANFWEIGVYGLADSDVNNNWDESSITLSNSPASGTYGANFTSGFAFLGSVNISTLIAGDRITFSDSSLLNFLDNDTDGLITLGLRRLNGGRTDSSFVLASKENSAHTGPTLSLNVQSVAEPTTFLLLGLGIAGLGFGRRRGKI